MFVRLLSNVIFFFQPHTASVTVFLLQVLLIHFHIVTLPTAFSTQPSLAPNSLHGCWSLSAWKVQLCSKKVHLSIEQLIALWATVFIKVHSCVRTIDLVWQFLEDQHHALLVLWAVFPHVFWEKGFIKSVQMCACKVSKLCKAALCFYVVGVADALTSVHHQCCCFTLNTWLRSENHLDLALCSFSGIWTLVRSESQVWKYRCLSSRLYLEGALRVFQKCLPFLTDMTKWHY